MKEKELKSIEIFVWHGLVIDVKNVPDGYDYKIVDLNGQEE